MNVKNREDIYELLGQYFTGVSLSNKDRNSIKDWLLDSQSNRNTFDKLKKAFSEGKYLKAIDEVKVDDVWNNFNSKLEKTKYINLNIFIKYVAIIIPLVGISLFWFFSSRNDPISTPQYVKDDLNKLHGGKHKAELTLSDGKTINLCNVTKVVSKTNNLAITTDSTGILEYKSTGKIDAQYNSIYVPRAGEYKLILQDGTSVWINSDTRLKFPTAFTGNIRKVYLEGEAYFSVSKNKNKPFIVSSKNMDIEVLGTEFNFNSYESNKTVDVVLVEGSVRYKAANFNNILKPNQKVSYNRQSREIEVKDVDITKYISWKDGIYIFDKISLEDLGKKISRWYNVEIFFVNSAVRKKAFTGVIEKYKSLKFIVELLESTNSVKCRLKGNVLYIE